MASLSAEELVSRVHLEAGHHRCDPVDDGRDGGQGDDGRPRGGQREDAFVGNVEDHVGQRDQT